MSTNQNSNAGVHAPHQCTCCLNMTLLTGIETHQTPRQTDLESWCQVGAIPLDLIIPSPRRNWFFYPICTLFSSSQKHTLTPEMAAVERDSSTTTPNHGDQRATLMYHKFRSRIANQPKTRPLFAIVSTWPPTKPPPPSTPRCNSRWITR